MIKIPYLFQSGTIPITQSPHGEAQDDTSLDLASGDLTPGLPCEVYPNKVRDNLGFQSYFDVHFEDGSYLQCVHGYPTRTGKFAPGEVVGVNAVPKSGSKDVMHWHMSINLNIQQKWVPLPCVVDKSNKLINAGGLKFPHWFNFDYWYRTYGNYSLNIKNSPMTREQYLIEAKAWNDNVGVKGYLADNSKIINKKYDEMTTEDEDILIYLYRTIKYIQASPNV